MELCLVAGRRPGACVSKRWWEQNNIGLDGVREAERMEEAKRDWGEQSG